MDDSAPRKPSALWVDRFAARLGELQNNIEPNLACELAEATYDEAFDLDPVEAAEIFALEQPPGEVGGEARC